MTTNAVLFLCNGKSLGYFKMLYRRTPGSVLNQTLSETFYQWRLIRLYDYGSTKTTRVCFIDNRNHNRISPPCSGLSLRYHYRETGRPEFLISNTYLRTNSRVAFVPIDDFHLNSAQRFVFSKRIRMFARCLIVTPCKRSALSSLQTDKNF